MLHPVRVPGSKSVTNRALLLAALAPGTSRFRGGLEAEDTRWMRGALSCLGLGFREEEGAWIIEGGRRPEPSAPLWLGASGTTLRFLLPWLALSARGAVRLEGDPSAHSGRVARLSPSIQEQNRTLNVEAEVANPGGRLRPGSFARAEIVVEADRTAVTVPASAVVAFAGLEKVFGVKDGKSVEKRIRTGRRSGDRVEVLEGVAAGEAVVADPGNLVGGTPVTVTR